MKRILFGATATWLAFSGLVAAQSPLTVEDTQEINALAAGYASALGSCDANGFANLFVPETGYFSSGFRGQIVGREGLIGLVESERHCNLPEGTQPAPRPGGNTPAVQIEVTAHGATGIADLGPQVGQYEDHYVKTPSGWRIASRTVVTSAELAAGLTASDLAAINELGGPSPGNRYAERDGVVHLLSTGVVVSVADGKVTGRAYQTDGSYFDDVYEKTAAGEWSIQSRTHVPAE